MAGLVMQKLCASDGTTGRLHDEIWDFFEATFRAAHSLEE